MSNTFTNRHGRKYGLFVKGFDRIAPEYASKKMVEENPNWLQERYPNWDWRTEEERRADWTVGRR